MIDAIPLLLAPEGYQISRSVRLRSSATAYLNRTPASASNRKTWTWSGWVKRGALGSLQTIFSANNSASVCVAISFLATDNLRFYASSSTASQFFDTAAVFRDPSAWYHLVFVLDTTQATIANRTKIFVNGVAMSGTTTGDVVQNADSLVNATNIHEIGKFTGGTNYFDGYLTEINFIDGQALTPSSFGETNPVTGVWQPKKYTGTYGTNGFYLNFSDNSNNTAATIGKDYSGNGNNWTPNNISVTAGATYDSMLDVPTQWADGGNGRGNYAVLNPLKTTTAPTQGNLALSGTSGAFVDSVYGTIGVTGVGKYYFEVTGGYIVGFNFSDVNPATNQTTGRVVYHGAVGSIFDGASAVQTGLATVTSTDVVGVALNLDAGTLAFYKNNVQVGTNVSITVSNTWWPFLQNTNTYTSFANFGQRPFAYTPPSGFRALNTLNLPTPTILKGNQFFDVSLYSGSTGNTVNVTNSGAMQPDFVWLKNRSAGAGGNHILHDALRGNFSLSSDLTNAEIDQSVNWNGYLSNGFSVKGSTGQYNLTGNNYVGWQWKEGATQGFDIVTYTGTGANRTVAHNLGVAPRMMIVKARSAVNDWPVYHAAAASAANGCAFLNATNAYAASATVWNNTAPTSSVFTVGTGSGSNANGVNFVAYLFAEVAGFSRAFSYTGNGSADGPFVHLGFRPRWIMFKKTSATGNWSILDTARDDFNVADNPLLPNTSGAETTSTSISGAFADILSNGFKLRGNSGDINDSAATYIGFAFAEVPYKFALGR
jgi:hypothetical protein